MARRVIIERLGFFVDGGQVQGESRVAPLHLQRLEVPTDRLTVEEVLGGLFLAVLRALDRAGQAVRPRELNRLVRSVDRGRPCQTDPGGRLSLLHLREESCLAGAFKPCSSGDNRHVPFFIAAAHFLVTSRLERFRHLRCHVLQLLVLGLQDLRTHGRVHHATLREGFDPAMVGLDEVLGWDEPFSPRRRLVLLALRIT